MAPAIPLAAITLGQCAVMALAWVVQRRTRQSGWVDACWSLAVGAGGLAAALAPLDGTPPSARQILVSTLVGIWSARLAAHIAVRTRGGGDDPRYAQLMRVWGSRAAIRLFWFLQSQALAAALLTVAVYAAARNPAPGLGGWDVSGTVVLLVGIAGEGVADAQLARFRRRPDAHGRVCDAGLWRWSRHPNYFFEWLGWLAYPCFALAPGPEGVWPWGWLAPGGPVLMYVLLVHVSGLPPLEGHMARSRGAAFADYRRRTSAFFPWPPRRDTE
ncbi:DUF1295 domain-containing protein [Nitrospirillum sp. BR 11163]|uniref:DUF1295 domain-containing protein n=1 Tax=Nitrospirillum sp. BR 11163 TaxID=3104323 RepID=UPI002AFDC9DD|nr:DUF1295 domain-containing protein [Nitrospirillum sp. BR 11163]MEA1674903.1 DUF1295 domain-containing protein [Nitrospirillum sp. BR 11163]